MPELGGEIVRIRLGGFDCGKIERYEIRQSFFVQPSTFALRVGHAGVAARLLEEFHPGVDFELVFTLADGREVLQMSGVIDACGTEGGAGATEVTLRGRDWMAPLHDGMSPVEKTFGRATFADLTETVIKLAGVSEPTFYYTNEANTAAVQGIPKTETVQVVTERNFAIEDGQAARVALVSTGEAAGSPYAYDVLPATVDRIVAQPDTVATVTRVVGYTVPNPLKLALGTTFLHFLQQEHNRTGLFLIATANPREYVLTRPNVLAAPTWRIVRRRGMSWGIVETPQFNNDTAGRFSHYTVRGRGGGGTDSTGAVRKQIEGTYVDQEMVDYGLIKQWSHVDNVAKTSRQAEYLARRMAAEKARAGWHLNYKLRGLSWPTIAGGMAVWCRDSVVDIQDDELNIHGPHWISDVAQSGAANGPTTTTITLHKPAHQLYGDDVLPSRVAAKKGWPRK